MKAKCSRSPEGNFNPTMKDIWHGTFRFLVIWPAQIRTRFLPEFGNLVLDRHMSDGEGLFRYKPMVMAAKGGAMMPL